MMILPVKWERVFVNTVEIPVKEVLPKTLNKTALFSVHCFTAQKKVQNIIFSIKSANMEPK